MNQLQNKPVLKTALLGLLASASAALLGTGLQRLLHPNAQDVAVAVAVAAPGANENAAVPMAAAPIEPGPTAAPEEKPPAAVEAKLSYPDGSTHPALNGVSVALAPAFTASVPFAKVVGTEVDDRGLTWYLHENGARSTSLLDGRKKPLAMACMPIAGPVAAQR